jgi:phage shock protein PspC (stress-responsive transcriptional regulator)
VVAAKDTLMCKYVANPIEVFDVYIDFLKNREKIIWLHPAVRAGDSIPKPYFTYASGDIIMCGYRDDKMCPNLMDRGFFDAPLEFDTVPRVGNTIDSALEYCYELLKEGGMCERALPSTYSVWKVKSNNECGKKSYNKIVYKHPSNGDFKSMVEVDYSARKNVAKQDTKLFKVYKTLIISLWVMAMVFELRKLIMYFAWVAMFPGISNESDELEFDDEGNATIIGVSATNRIVIGLVTCLRFLMLCGLSTVGLSLLLQSPEYMSLIFDAVSLVFVIEIAELMYTNTLRDKVREETENISMAPFDKPGLAYFNERGSLVDVMWLILIAVAAVFLMIWYYKNSVVPMGQALMCTCLSTGEHCHEASKFNYDFWYQYWKIDTPQIFKDVDVLKKAWKEEKEESSLVQVSSQLAAAKAAARLGEATATAAAHRLASAQIANMTKPAVAAGKRLRRAGRAAKRLFHRTLA